ncbi:hypothetical protein M9H77_13038 [Catharanthus roseus]|uniref:Uncharacterized protein n=1 Tax=Catharanthus roseus TaxID=4058 RepID=A0ACC0BJ89_CATRO|nr:hypothetical protein M9H77_13038 [Catharanthus roseus]
MDMDTIHPHARDVYIPYFTGATKKIWTFTRLLTYDKLVRKILKHQEMDLNQWHVRMTMRVPSFYEDMNNNEFEPIQSQTFQMSSILMYQGLRIIQTFEDDENDEDADAYYDISSASDNDNDDNDEEDDISTPVNPLSSTIVN